MSAEITSIIIKFGMLIGEDRKLKGKSFNTMGELRIILNNIYNIDIKDGMAWEKVLEMLEKEINRRRFDNAMKII